MSILLNITICQVEQTLKEMNRLLLCSISQKREDVKNGIFGHKYPSIEHNKVQFNENVHVEKYTNGHIYETDPPIFIQFVAKC